MSVDPWEQRLASAASRVRKMAGDAPFELAVILGSGLGGLVEALEDCSEISYQDLGCFPPLSVAGHAGRLMAGELAGRRSLLFQGRFHRYQGLSARETTLPVRLAHGLGCRRLLLSNAAGGIHPDFRPGDFMFVADHLNLTDDNPLRGEKSDPFLDLSDLYRTELYPLLAGSAEKEGIRLHRGVLASLLGPSYETPAEVRMLKTLGADAVSMSTVHEAILGRYLGMEVAALSMVSNAAAGLSPGPLDHQGVLETAGRSSRDFQFLVSALVRLWA